MDDSVIPQFTLDDLASVRSMAPHIIAAAAKYGVPPEAIAGSLAVERFDQKDSWRTG
jgi:hypothetical protein